MLRFKITSMANAFMRVLLDGEETEVFLGALIPLTNYAAKNTIVKSFCYSYL